MACGEEEDAPTTPLGDVPFSAGGAEEVSIGDDLVIVRPSGR